MGGGRRVQWLDGGEGMGCLTYGRALLLGVLQGLTEFLPVSSSGHLVVARSLLGLDLPGLTFEVLLHLGTALAVVSVLWADVKRLIGAVFGWRRRDPYFRLAWLLVAAGLPAALIGFVLGDLVELYLAQPGSVGAMLLVTAALLFWGQRLARRAAAAGGNGEASALGLWQAIVVGLAQALAILPGISRSGATVVAGLEAGLGRAAAARFALLLSLPVIFGGAIYDLLSLAGTDGAVKALPLGPLAAGVLAAFLCGLVAVRVLLAAVRRAYLGWFGFYCAAVGLLVLLLAR